MIFQKPEFCRGIAMVLQGESLQAGCYVKQNASLGGLREKIVRKLIRDHTPSRFHVETGLVHCNRSGGTSRQCDILIHESATHAPFYRWEDFVVVHSTEARAIVEVKSTLDQQAFGDLLNIHTSLVEMATKQGRAVDFTPTFGFALNGVTFPSFVEYLRGVIDTNRLNLDGDDRFLSWPVCIAVQERNYLGVRPLRRMAHSTRPLAFCAVDFTQLQRPANETIDGIETGHFIEIYNSVLVDNGALFADSLYSWFNQVPTDVCGKVWITPNGEIHHGNIS